MIEVRTLRAFHSLWEFTDAELEMLISVARERRAPAGTVLCEEGMPGASCFLIVSGECEVVKSTLTGERILATMKPGSFLGQVALVDRRPRTATVRTSRDAVLLELLRDVFEQLIQTQSPLGLRFQEQIAIAGIRQLRTGLERLASLLPQRHLQRPARSSPQARPPVQGRPAVARPSPRASLPAKLRNAPQDDVLRYIQTSMDEWSMSEDDLDSIEVIQPEGIMTVAEKRSRKLGG